MKLVREHIEQFTRGRNPFKSLNIGKSVEIENWFKTWAPNVDYEIDDNLKIYVNGFLNFYKSKITFLPDNLYVGEHLDLRRTKIISLPDNLHIGGTLDITRTNITYLPDNLHIGGYLYMRGTKIISLPDDLYVKRKIYKDF